MKKSSLALFALGSLTGVAAFAQNTPSSILPSVTVTGNPLGATDLIAPTAQYTGAELLFRSQTTLGETLDGTPGVASTYFGPNASRPIIRGLDGDRVRILNNGSALSDVSSLSYDHAVTADPLSMQRVEVLRGPAALLYGGNALGGVVNVMDGRIPREPQFDAKGGMGGKGDISGATGNSEGSLALLLEGGNDRFGLHADAFHRSTSEVEVPVDLTCTKPGASQAARKICNSASETRGSALGGSVFFPEGFLGASVSQYQSDYGTVAEDEVTIGMRSEQVNIAGELRGLSGPLRSVKLHWGQTDYKHTEFEGSEVGTVFKSKGSDLRLEARHAPLGPVNGIIGVQMESTDFSADGEEAFAPYSKTRQSAFFAHEEWSLPWGRITGGVRSESVTVESAGNPQVDRFDVGSRSFNPMSFAAGALWNAAPGWQLTTNISTSERAPKDYELFANGPHLATNAYEIGDATLQLERSTNLDIGIQWKSGAHRVAVSMFANEFSNYLALQATGTQEDGLDAYAYAQVKARFTGLEASASVRLLDAGQTLDLEFRGDTVRARNTDTDEALPRIAPARVGATLIWAQGPWSARVGANHAAAQSDVPSGQLPTGTYTLWNASAGYTMKAKAHQALWFAKMENLTDTLAYSSSSILTQTAPGKAPLPGRTIKLGVRWSF